MNLHDENHCWCQFQEDVTPEGACICDQSATNGTDMTKMERTRDGEKQVLHVAKGHEHYYLEFDWVIVEEAAEPEQDDPCDDSELVGP